jgi:hypothetical protein
LLNPFVYLFYSFNKMSSQVSVFIEGNNDLGKLFGSTANVKTSVFNVPTSMSGLSAAVARVNGTTTSAVVVVPEGYTTSLTPTQISAALEKLSVYTTPVVAYLGTTNTQGTRKALYLNSAALDLLKQSIVKDPVTQPTTEGDDVPTDEYTFVPSPTPQTTTVVIGARALDMLDLDSYLESLIASNAVQKVDVGIVFTYSAAAPAAAPAPAQVTAAYSAWLVSSPASEDVFQGSPDVAAETITFYDPNQLTGEVEEDIIVASEGDMSTTTTTPTTTPTIVVQPAQCEPASSSMTSSWWVWLIIIIIIIVLLIVSVVVYYKK